MNEQRDESNVHQDWLDRIRRHTLDLALDAVLEQRVQLHKDRLEGRLAVDGYLVGLRAVRDVEGLLEPLRRELGAEHTRAYELETESMVAVADPVTPDWEVDDDGGS